MSITNFLELVEIKTKLASLFPFLIGLFFVNYYFNEWNPVNTLLFFVAMIIFDMLTTMINNYMDYQKAKSHNYKNETNVIGREQLSIHLIQIMMIVMFSLTIVLGLILTARTSLLLFLIGAICCFVGIFYTAGPIPLSRMPLGEAFSGLTMGFGILFIVVLINVSDNVFVLFKIVNWRLLIDADLINFFAVILVSIPLIFTISNIMLANNTCDLEEDIANHRYTLPYYIGQKNAVLLFNCLMYVSYIILFFGIIFKVYPIDSLLVFFTLPIVIKNLKQYNAIQKKSETFSISVKNLVIFNGATVLSFLLNIVVDCFVS